MPPSIETVWIATIAASLLRRGRALAVLSGALLLAGLAAVLAASLMGLKGLALGFAASLLPGLVSLWFSLRTALDADLFLGIARHGDLAAFDRAMLSLGLMGPERAGRPLERRVEGALRLLKWQAIAAAIQGIILGFLVVIVAFSMPTIGSG